jgi:hypothetical protein
MVQRTEYTYIQELFLSRTESYFLLLTHLRNEVKLYMNVVSFVQIKNFASTWS